MANVSIAVFMAGVAVFDCGIVHMFRHERDSIGSAVANIGMMICALGCAFALSA